MRSPANGAPETQLDCEECGSAEAQRVRVKFEDEKTNTLSLCEQCLNDFRNAELVDETFA